MRVAGIMSGTSLDGIDVAIVDINGRGASTKVRPVTFRTTPYSAAIRKAILSVSNTDAHVGDVARLHTRLGELYGAALARTCEKSDVEIPSIDLIGCHGQTIFHDGAGTRFLGRRIATTLQIGDAARLAERVGAPVVSDFRTRDMAAGGRGAPLVPYVDYFLFRDPKIGRVALNVGGIANITAIPPGAGTDKVVAFDTGPGNMVIDSLAAHFSGGKVRFDRNGAMASKGRLSKGLLTSLLGAGYYRRVPPKTAGREQYGSEFRERLLAAGLDPEDLLATATALTGASIATGIERFVRPVMTVDELVASGGGVHNPVLMAYLAGFLPDVRVRTSDEFGVDPDAKEAIAFAILAYETWHGRPSNLPSATGAEKPVVLGKISPVAR